ncbi:MAG: type IV pilus modification PilV family protein [Deefgea sp.]
MFNRQSYRSQIGVGLIEVLISLLILAGGFLALTRFQAQLTQNQAIAMQRAEATLVADRFMNVLVVGLNGRSSQPTSSTTVRVNGVNAIYEIHWLSVTKSSVSPNSFNNNTNCVSSCDVLRVDVAVYWNDASGSRNNVSLSRLLSMR